MIRIFLMVLFVSFPALAQHRTVATPVRLQKPVEQLTALEQEELSTLRIGNIDLSASQIAERQAEESNWLGKKPMRDWNRQMEDITLSDDLENIIDAMDTTTRARISAETLDKYNAKKSLRLLKP